VTITPTAPKEWGNARPRYDRWSAGEAFSATHAARMDPLGMASPSIPGWNQIVVFLTSLRQLRGLNELRGLNGPVNGGFTVQYPHPSLDWTVGCRSLISVPESMDAYEEQPSTVLPKLWAREGVIILDVRYWVDSDASTSSTAQDGEQSDFRQTSSLSRDESDDKTSTPIRDRSVSNVRLQPQVIRCWYNRLRLRPTVPVCHALHPGRYVIAARSLMASSLHSGGTYAETLRRQEGEYER
jgi:hypothetical protein